MAKANLYWAKSNEDWQPVQRDNPMPMSISDYAGRSAAVTTFGDAITAGRIQSVSVQFQYNVATDDVNTTTANGGTITQTDAQAIVASSTAATGSAIVQSKESIRYQPGYEAVCQVSVEFDDAVAGANQYIGVYDGDNGFFVGYTGTSFGVTLRRNGTDTTVAQADFNLDTIDGNGASGLDVNFQYLNVFRISFGWHGIAPITFEVLSPNEGWVAFHRIESPNSRAGVTILNPVLPIRAEVTKTSGGTDVQLKTASWLGVHVGQDTLSEANRYKSYDRSLTIATGADRGVITIRSSTAFQSLTNHVTSELAFLSVAADGTKNVKFKVIKNAILATSTGGTPTYTDVDAVNSVMQVSTNAISSSSGVTELVLNVGKEGSDKVDTTGFGIRVYPGDTLTFAAQSAGASDVDVAVRWLEEF